MRIISNIESIKKRVGKENTQDRWMSALVVFALVLSVLFFAGERMLCSRINYELIQVMALQQDLQQVGRRLQLEKASLENPIRLAREAKKLGLRPPGEAQVVTIETR